VPTKRCLVISDTHISDVEDHDDGWKRYKSTAHLVDSRLHDLLRGFMDQQRDGEQLLLILAGDIFDFDVTTCVPEAPPWPMSAREWTRGLEPSEAKAVWKIQRVLDHHPHLVTALADYLGRGHAMVYVLGNHDRELHFEGVRRALLDAIRARAADLGLECRRDPIRFEPWFYYDPDGLYVEHGSQYDIYSSFPYLLDPVARVGSEEILSLPLGGFSNRYLVSVLGYFNPRSSDYICNAIGYFAHWRRFYAGSGRGILRGWIAGSGMVLARVFGLRRQLGSQAAGHARRLEQTARRYDLPVGVLRALDDLKPRPIYYSAFRILREYWLDRVLLALTLTVAALVLLLSSAPLLFKLLLPTLGGALLVTLYEKLVASDGVFTVDEEIKGYSREIAELLAVPVVVMGHTHKAGLLQLTDDAYFVNTGTWAPMYTWRCWDEPHPGNCNALSVVLDRDRISLDLQSMDPCPGDSSCMVVILRSEDDEEEPTANPVASRGRRRRSRG